jgi:hypothetical protein
LRIDDDGPAASRPVFVGGRPRGGGSAAFCRLKGLAGGFGLEFATVLAMIAGNLSRNRQQKPSRLP